MFREYRAILSGFLSGSLACEFKDEFENATL